MFYTHYNLQDLDFECVEMSPNFEGETSELKIILRTPLKESRNGITLVFYMNDFMYRSSQFNIQTGLRYSKVNFVHQKRGIIPISKVSFETTFPFNLFKSFIYFNSNTNIVTYPEIIHTKRQSNTVLIQESGTESEPFVREYQSGDKINSILWKKNILEKVFVKYFEAQADNFYELQIIDNDNADLKEQNLKEVCSALVDLYKKGEKCYLIISNQKVLIVPHDQSAFDRCLYLLASYES